MNRAALPTVTKAKPLQAPAWMQQLLYGAAEHLAMRWNAQAAAVDFEVPSSAHGPAMALRASLLCEPAAAYFRLYVHERSSGRFVCRSLPVVLDEVDAEVWNNDLSQWAIPMTQAVRTSSCTADEDEEHRACERMHRQVTHVFGLLARQHQGLAEQVFSALASRQPTPQLPTAWPVAVPSIPDFVLELDCPSAAAPDHSDQH